jgi:hypothetical protein
MKIVLRWLLAYRRLLSILPVNWYESVKIKSGQHGVVFKTGSGFDCSAGLSRRAYLSAAAEF